MSEVALRDWSFLGADATLTHQCVKQRDVLDLMGRSNLFIHGFDPTDEQIDWLERQLFNYCKTIKPRLMLPGLSRGGRYFFAVARSCFSFGCIYQILCLNLSPTEPMLASMLASDIAFGMILNGTADQQLIYRKAMKAAKEKVHDDRTDALQNEFNKLSNEDKFKSTIDAMMTWVSLTA